MIIKTINKLNFAQNFKVLNSKFFIFVTEVNQEINQYYELGTTQVFVSSHSVHHGHNTSEPISRSSQDVSQFEILL